MTNHNVAVGFNALLARTTGSYNTAIGYAAGYASQDHFEHPYYDMKLWREILQNSEKNATMKEMIEQLMVVHNLSKTDE